MLTETSLHLGMSTSWEMRVYFDHDAWFVTSCLVQHHLVENAQERL